MRRQRSQWNGKDIIKISPTHMQDAPQLTLWQEWSGCATMLSDDPLRLEEALK
jgi:fumarate hydratase class II